jgi:hypothetical protein
MTGKDGLWDWPCGSLPAFVDCGAQVDGTTGKPYERWQVGAGMLNVGGALSKVASLSTTAPASGSASGGTVPTGEPPAPLPSSPPPGGSAEPQRTVLGPTPAQVRRQRALLKKCRTLASRKKTRQARARARAKCKARFG